MIKMYKVGGYVRDKLLGIESEDIDYVVVGATAIYMQKMGFVPVGRHFPVFIDPKTQTQYALARTERKTGVGYHGFEFYAAPDVTLEEDLERRDITINAIAEDENGNLIDPFNGAADLKHKIIRHISPAFAEDPLRVLRVARFRAKFGFNIASETLKLMRQICEKNELEHLSIERIWDELKKSLTTHNPIEFFIVLNQTGALEHIFTDFKIITTDKQLYTKITENLNEAIKLNYSNEEKFAIIVGNINKYSLEMANRIIQTCKLGRHYSDLVYVINKNLKSLLQLRTLTPAAILQLMKNIDPIRRPDRFEEACRVFALIGVENQVLNFIKEIANQFKQIDYKKFDGMKQHTLLEAINTTKLTTCSNLHQQFFGA